MTATSPPVIVAAGADHLWRFTQGSASPARCDQGLTGNFGFQIAIDPQQPSHIYLAAGNNAGLSMSPDSGNSWINLLSGDAYAVAVDPFDSSHLLASIDSLDPWSSSNSSLQVSGDGGATWQDGPSPVQPQPTLGAPASAIIFDPNTSGTIYLGYGLSYGVAKSTDGGQTWSFINNGLTNLNITSLAISPVDSKILIAGTMGGIFTSGDAGNTWALTSPIEPVSIVFDKNTAQTVYASNTQLFKSTDNGKNWNPVNVGRSDVAFMTLAVDPKTAGVLFAMVTSTQGYAVSVGWSPDAGTSWSWLSKGLGQVNFGANIGSIAGQPFFVSAVSETTPEVLFIPSPTVGVVSLVLQY